MNQMIKILESDRLILKPLTKEHANTMFEKYCDERIYDYIEADIPESLEWLEKQFEIISTGEFIRNNGDKLIIYDWAIYLKDTNLIIGRSEFTVFPNGECNVAYVIFPEHWKQGYAFEATKLALEFMRKLNIASWFKICCDTENVASRRIAEKLNFHYSHIDYGCNHLKDRIGDDFVFHDKLK